MTDKTSETKNGHDCDIYDCKYIKTASTSVGKAEGDSREERPASSILFAGVKDVDVGSAKLSDLSSAPNSEPQLPDNIDWGHDPTKDLCSRCKHTKEMHQDNCEIINCGCMKFTVKLGESELCKHEMLAITGVDCIRKIRCHKCNKDWFSLQDFIEEIRQQSELKGFNEGINKVITLPQLNNIRKFKCKNCSRAGCDDGNEHDLAFVEFIKSSLKTLKRSG